MNNSFESLKLLLENNADLIDVGLPASDPLIRSAEQYLGLEFDDAFKLYLATWGHLAIGPLEFYGLTSGDFENNSIPDAIWFTHLKRVQIGLPKHLIAIFNNDGDEYYCVDTSRSGEIVIWDAIQKKLIGTKSLDMIHLVLQEFESFLK